MQLPVMTTAEGQGEFIADLHPLRPWLGETQVMRIGGLTSADKAGLQGSEFEMWLAAPTATDRAPISKRTATNLINSERCRSALMTRRAIHGSCRIF